MSASDDIRQFERAMDNWGSALTLLLKNIYRRLDNLETRIDDHEFEHDPPAKPGGTP